MDPSFLQLSRIIYQEKLQAVTNEEGFSKAATAVPGLRERILSSVGAGLIFIGQRLKVGQQKDSLKSVSTSTNQARS